MIRFDRHLQKELSVSKEDFLAMENATTPVECERLAKIVFDLVDTDHSGFLSQEELKAMY